MTKHDFETIRVSVLKQTHTLKTLHGLLLSDLEVCLGKETVAAIYDYMRPYVRDEKLPPFPTEFCGLKAVESDTPRLYKVRRRHFRTFAEKITDAD